MSKSLLVISGLLVFFVFGSSRAEDVDLERIVVTPSRVEESSETTGNSISVISNTNFQQRNLFTVKENLKGASGLDIAGTGGMGGATSVFLRGSSAGQIRVMMDGVKVYDPSSTDASYDFAHLSTGNIERIEILRGPQSSLYGSDAIGGVINIITKKGLGKPKISITSEGGSYYTSREALEISGEKEKLHFSLSTSRLDARGFSEAKEKNNNPEDDAYQNTNASLRLDYDIASGLTFGLLSHYLHARTEYDDYDYINNRPTDDPDRIRWDDEGILSLFLDHKIADSYRHKLQLSYTRNYRRGMDDTDEYERDWYDGKTYQLDWQSELKVLDFDQVILGANYLREEADTYYFHNIWGETDTPKSTSDIKGAFIENKLTLFENMFLNAVYRMDHHSHFKNHDTYKLDMSYLIDKTDTRIKGLFGTGYKSPSLYQLSAPPMWGLPSGNPNLKPEESESYEIGIEQGFLKRMFCADVTYFRTHFKSLIDFVYGSGYINLSTARAYGIESSLKFRKDGFTCKAGYVWLDTENKETGDELLKRAKNKANLEFNWEAPGWDLNFGLRYAGNRPDYMNKLLKAYVLANVSFDYKINKNLTIFGRIENVFNEKYEETKDYQTPGFSIYSGFKLKL